VGLDSNGIKLMLYVRRLGVDFTNVVTIGRQGMHLSYKQVQRQLSKFGLACPSEKTFGDLTYCEPFFRFLGASAVESIDYSHYENATIIHDMNKPIEEGIKGRFSAVVDAGTLEHIFNCAVAIKNCMELVKVGGHFVGITPTNNFMGHGFYQFSPELFFAVFRAENGFEILKMIICEDYEDAPWYEVSKPSGGIKGRVTLVNHQPTYLMCIARRIACQGEPFRRGVQQPAYMEEWEKARLGKDKSDTVEVRGSGQLSLVRDVLKRIPGAKRVARSLRYISRPKFPRQDFTPLDPIS
jgi:hypothetical protein